MNFLLLSSLAASLATALARVDHSDCVQQSSQRPSVSSAPQCSSQVEDSGVVLLAKRSAISKAVFKHEAADIEVGDKANHTQKGVAEHDRFSVAIGALWNKPKSLIFERAAARPGSSTAAIAKSSPPTIWLMMLVGCGLILALVVLQLQRSKGKTEIYDEDNDVKDGWKHESWVRGHHHKREEVDRTEFLAARLARGERASDRPTYSNRDEGGQPVYQDAWMRSGSAAASSSNQSRQEALIRSGDAVGQSSAEFSGKVEDMVRQHHEAAVGTVARAGSSAWGSVKTVTKAVKGHTEKVVRKIDKATGKPLTKLGGAIGDASETTQAKLKQRWDEARVAHIPG